MTPETYTHVRVPTSPHERGRQYGELTRSRVRRSVEAYADVFRRWADLDWNKVRNPAEAYVPFRPQSFLAYVRPRIASLDAESLQGALSLYANHPVDAWTHADEDLAPGEQAPTITSAVIDLAGRTMWIADGSLGTTSYRTVDYADSPHL